MTSSDFLPVGRSSIDGEKIRAVVYVLRSERLLQGLPAQLLFLFPRLGIDRRRILTRLVALLPRGAMPPYSKLQRNRSGEDTDRE